MEDIGFWDESKCEAFMSEAEKIIGESSIKQQNRIKTEDPINLFVEYLIDYASDKRIIEYMSDMKSSSPVGWQDVTFIYLKMEPVYRLIIGDCNATGHNFPISKKTLIERLKSSGIIETDNKGEWNIRKRFGDYNARVALIKKETINNWNE
jgi:hypothetical protein